jgi:hypothetical protein
MSQGGEPFISLEDYVSAFTAIATIGPASRYELLAAKADGSIATRAGYDAYFC